MADPSSKDLSRPQSTEGWAEPSRWFERCPDCGVVAYAHVRPGRHSPHWKRGVLVNCVGKPIQPEEAK